MADIDWRRAAEALTALAMQQQPRFSASPEGPLSGSLNVPGREFPRMQGGVTLPQPGGVELGVSGSVQPGPRPQYGTRGTLTLPFGVPK